MTVVSDAIVIGGGLHGLSAALHLARRGLSVVVLERARIGRHASGASAAGVRTLGRARAELPASLIAMDMWYHMEDLVGDDCGFLPNGQVVVAETDAELAGLAENVAALRRDGFTNEEVIDAETLREVVPAVSPHCVGAVMARRDGAADPHRTLHAFYASCLASGVAVIEGAGVSMISKRGELWRCDTGASAYEAPLMVNAAGAWAGQIAAQAGDDVPLGTKASMMIVTERVGPYVKPTVSAAGRALSFKQTSQGTLLIGGGQQGRPDLERESTEIDAVALARAAAAAVAIFPAVEGLRINRAWAGLEAKTSDDVAIAGLSPSHGNLMHLFGFCGHGFQLIPVLGRVAADLLLDGDTDVDVSGLAPRRLMAEGAPLFPDGVNR